MQLLEYHVLDMPMYDQIIVVHFIHADTTVLVIYHEVLRDIQIF